MNLGLTEKFKKRHKNKTPNLDFVSEAITYFMKIYEKKFYECKILLRPSAFCELNYENRFKVKKALGAGFSISDAKCIGIRIFYSNLRGLSPTGSP